MPASPKKASVSAQILAELRRFNSTLEEYLRSTMGPEHVHRQLPPEPNQDFMQRISAKIELIKAVRSRTGMGLRESKEFVELYMPEPCMYPTGPQLDCMLDVIRRG